MKLSDLIWVKSDQMKEPFKMERGDYLILKKSRALVELPTHQPTVQEGDTCEAPQKPVFQEDKGEVNPKTEGYSDEYNKLRSKGIIRHLDGTE